MLLSKASPVNQGSVSQINQPKSFSLFTLFQTEFLSLGILSLISNLMMLVPTLYMLQLYDRVMLSKSELTLLNVSIITACLFVVMALAEWMRALAIIKAGVRFDQQLNSRIFNLTFKNALLSEGSKSNEAMQDLTNVRQFLSGNGVFAFFDMPWSVLYIAVLFIMSPVVGVVAIGFCLIQLCFAFWNQRSSNQPIKQVIEAQLENQRFIHSKIRNIETTYVMGMMPRLLERWQHMQMHFNHLTHASSSTQSRNQHINKFVRYTMQSLMLGTAAFLAVQGKISLGSMIASNVLIARALQPFDMIVSTWKQTVLCRESIKRLNQLLSIEKKTPAITITPEISGQIQLKSLSVTLKNLQRPTLIDLNLDIQPGQILTIMGASGSGKTTLSRCLTGILPVQSGQLLVGGIPIDKIESQHFATSLGYLPQDVELLVGTIAENIARFNVEDSADIIKAAQLAGMHESILRLPQGYDTQIDQSASMLSGGQRQLIGLARAFYKEPFILVLDEPNANLDERGDISLFNALNYFRSRNTTIVVISHRKGLLKITDKLLIMNAGEIQHYGPCDEILAQLDAAKLPLTADAA